MEGHMITITLENEQVTCPEGTTLHELSQQYQGNYKYPIIVAKCDGVIQELYHEVTDGMRVEFCTTNTVDGTRVYRRGISMMVLKAMRKEIPLDKLEKVVIEFSLDTGYFCRVFGDVELNQDLIDRVEKRMRSYVERDIKFEKQVIRTRDAKDLFQSWNMKEKGNLMDYRRNSRMTIYNLGHYTN